MSQKDLEPKVMKREDVGFALSRVLSVWLATTGIKALGDAVDPMVRAYSASGTVSSALKDTLFIPNAIGFCMVAAGLFALAIICWTKADRFMPVPSAVLDETDEADIVEISGLDIASALVMVLGLSLVVYGIAGVGSKLTDSFFSEQMGSLRSRPGRETWQGFAFHACLGVLVLVMLRNPRWLLSFVSKAPSAET